MGELRLRDWWNNVVDILINSENWYQIVPDDPISCLQRTAASAGQATLLTSCWIPGIVFLQSTGLVGRVKAIPHDLVITKTNWHSKYGVLCWVTAQITRAAIVSPALWSLATDKGYLVFREIWGSHCYEDGDSMLLRNVGVCYETASRNPEQQRQV